MEMIESRQNHYVESRSNMRYTATNNNANYEDRREIFTVENAREFNQNLNQTRSQRIRAALFPETLEDVSANTIANQNQFIKQITNGKPTAVQRLSGPSQLLKTAVLNLINYQEDADATLKAIPELIKLLNDDDRTVCVKAVGLIEQLSKKDASRHALINSQNLLTSLINLINNCNDIEIQKLAASTLYNIGNNQNGLLMLFKSGGIAALVKLLSSPIDSTVRYAISTLHNLLIYEDNAKIQVRKCGGIQKFVQLLNHNDAKVLCIILDCLHILAFSNAESKLIMAASGCPKELVRIIRNSNTYEKLLWTCVRLMKVLSICTTNKPLLIKSGAMHALAEHLERPLSARTILNCLLTLRNLSDSAIREENLDGLIRKLIEYLSTNQDMNVSICAAGILSNLTCNNDINKTKFVEYNGIEALVRTIVQSNENSEEIYEPIVCSLRHVTNRHGQAYKAQEAIRFNYGLPVIVHILQNDTTKWPLLKACIGLIRNLALSDNNLAPLRELGVIPRLVQLLIRSFNYYQQNGSDAIVDDVPVDEIIEACAGALHQLARDSHNRVIIRELKCIPLLVQLLYIPSECIQKVACGCLCELSNEKESTELIDNERATDKLTELLRSKDEGLATYAAAVLFRISEDKPNQQQQLSHGNVYSTIRLNHDNNMVDGNLNSQYHVYNPYELELQHAQHDLNNLQIDQIKNNQIQQQQQLKHQQQPTWFDTDL